MTSKIILYGVDLSPCVRAVKLTLKALNLDYEYKEVNLSAGEHLKEDFLKMNPQHTVPVLNDNGFIIWESHAVITYLVDKYGKSDLELYPKDAVKRAVVNQRLYFDATVLFASLAAVSGPFWRSGVTVVPQEKLDAVQEALRLTEVLLSDTHIAGNTLTLADFSAATMVTSLPAVVDIDSVKYPKVLAWLERIKQEVPYFDEINSGPAKQYCDYLRSQWTKLGD
ncbi:glutathione S-transferase 1 [Drosophila tropicalis]|uniref:glutathione S-transferase 1 n=1 Tax=Drosophila tropicalis TaxID=46794 RepID=UPI0035ABEE3E